MKFLFVHFPNAGLLTQTTPQFLQFCAMYVLFLSQHCYFESNIKIKLSHQVVMVRDFIGVLSGIYVVLFDIQFLQIQTVLQNTGEEGQDELVKLRDDLVELIHVSEGA